MGEGTSVLQAERESKATLDAIRRGARKAEADKRKAKSKVSAGARGKRAGGRSSSSHRHTRAAGRAAMRRGEIGLISKIKKGYSVRGAYDYMTRDEKHAEHVYGTVDNWQQMWHSIMRRPDIKEPVFFPSLSLPPGETLSNENWGKIARRYMEIMEFPPDTPWRAYKHPPTTKEKKEHVHILASRISLSGNVWGTKNDVFRSIKACQILEQEFRLKLAPVERKQKAKLTKNEIEMGLRQEQKPPKLVIAQAIDEAIQLGAITPAELASVLEKRGISCRLKEDSRGISGASFSLDGISFKGSQVGEEYRAKRLSDRLKERHDNDQTRTAPDASIPQRKGDAIATNFRFIGDNRDATERDRIPEIPACDLPEERPENSWCDQISGPGKSQHQMQNQRAKPAEKPTGCDSAQVAIQAAKREAALRRFYMPAHLWTREAHVVYQLLMRQQLRKGVSLREADLAAIEAMTSTHTVCEAAQAWLDHSPLSIGLAPEQSLEHVTEAQQVERQRLEEIRKEQEMEHENDNLKEMKL